MCSVFGPTVTSAGEDDDPRHSVHVGECGFPVGVVFETFCGYGNIKTVVWKVEGFSVTDMINAGAGCDVNTDITGWGEEIADCAVDVE